MTVRCRLQRSASIFIVKLLWKLDVSSELVACDPSGSALLPSQPTACLYIHRMLPPASVVSDW